MKYLVLTGGSKGIGEKTIAYFMQHGWQAINISRSACKLPHVTNIKVDLSQVSTISNHADSLRHLLKNAETICLVHNAGHYERDSIETISIESLQRTLAVNVVAAVALNEIIIPLMKPNSSIIYIGSTLSEKAVPNAASYVVSKHAVVGLMRATCQDLKDKLIRSNCVCPGVVDTPMLKDTMDEKIQKFLIETKIMGKRLIEPDEIAEVIYFCAVTPVINNVVLHANLGQVAD